ncbi:hypothetical protein SNOG_15105 [Parastagonospora nodorum SN15]|uniref:Uncharacterized protein n=1 Tax=Phaeosphaeria nodorum (strain SN15 / ATCC MYA-4574 / FGSC 10173) TaxID=321614 RepID=Q0TZU3_PHANO|nr:hypothetical protein SNOG_15105 [Parastagonospora nodorum SN15]EAT77648.1 hypothetical protein SNOG_15105 [Parastagonospora nodorum SN15]
MSAPFADQTPARVPGILNNIASELHLNGHLVSTGWIDEGSPGNSLFIHISYWWSMDFDHVGQVWVWLHQQFRHGDGLDVDFGNTMTNLESGQKK